MPRHRVLIVEDEQDIAGLIKHSLERGGDTEAQIVGSGDAALKAVTAQVPDVIVLDLNLPVIGGLEVCRVLRSRADVPHVPIIMLTARAGEDDRVSGLEQGADDYVIKPFSVRELVARVKAALRRGPASEPQRSGSYDGAHLRADFEAVFATNVTGGSPVDLKVDSAGRLYFPADDGTTFVLKASSKFEVIHKNKLKEEVYASPALSDGQIFIRGAKHLYCIGHKRSQ